MGFELQAIYFFYFSKRKIVYELAGKEYSGTFPVSDTSFSVVIIFSGFSGVFSSPGSPVSVYTFTMGFAPAKPVKLTCVLIALAVGFTTCRTRTSDFSFRVAVTSRSPDTLLKILNGWAFSAAICWA